MREKLIELLKNIPQVNHAQAAVDGLDYVFGCAADHLIANGVIIPRWIPVTERLPEDFEEVLVYDGDFVQPGVHFRGRFDEYGNYESYEIYGVTHWMPLPEPPEEG